MYDAPIAERMNRPRVQPLTFKPFYTQMEVSAIEAACKATCREQWKGAVLIGVLIGFAMASTVSVLLRW
jgi:hypothetical protein